VLLVAILIPVASAARERGQRTVCLNNLHQLTLAWTMYADQHDGKLVCGTTFCTTAGNGRWTMEGWAGSVGSAFMFPASRSDIVENPDKGPLWPYLRDIDIYRCPGGRKGHGITYAIVSGANGSDVEGTYTSSLYTGGSELTEPGKRAGRTVLRLTRLTDITSPGPAERAVFLDQGQTQMGDFYVYYLYPRWEATSIPPRHHAKGVTVSMADGHAEYWAWKGRETTTALPRKLVPARNVFIEVLAKGSSYEPTTDDGLYDLQRMQRATWGRLGYPAPEDP
jgi:prepilin-type processing-associated H-X9-DG protein